MLYLAMFHSQRCGRKIQASLAVLDQQSGARVADGLTPSTTAFDRFTQIDMCCIIDDAERTFHPLRPIATAHTTMTIARALKRKSTNALRRGPGPDPMVILPGSPVYIYFVRAAGEEYA